MINESTAIALQYGFFRKKELDAKEAKVVAFVDFGHSKTTVTLASFVQGKTKIICHKSLLSSLPRQNSRNYSAVSPDPDFDFYKALM